MRKTLLIVSSLALAVLAACASQPTAPAPPWTRPTTDQVYARPTIDQAIADGVAFLISSQNPDGSWGTGTVSHGNEVMVSVPSSHEAFQAAVTSLCVMALREVGGHDQNKAIHAAHDKGVEYLLSHPDQRRGDAELIYNIWAHLYVVQALAEESRTNHDPRIKQVMDYQLDRMARYETYTGGWNYYDFNGGTEQPAGGATSFGTSAGLIALYEARQMGWPVSDAMVKRGMVRLEECRLPNGACLYDSDLRDLPLLPADMPRGSAFRAVGADLALVLWQPKLAGGAATPPDDPVLSPWQSKPVDAAACRSALDLFFREHPAVEMGRKLNYPHVSWYQVSGYYYYFDHYYAARLIEYLGPEAKKQYARQLLDVMLPHQEPDGSWWDYPMWDYHKPYGTAFAIMTLLRCK